MSAPAYAGQLMLDGQFVGDWVAGAMSMLKMEVLYIQNGMSGSTGF